jgi:hypothetical protein
MTTSAKSTGVSFSIHKQNKRTSPNCDKSEKMTREDGRTQRSKELKIIRYSLT